MEKDRLSLRLQTVADYVRKGDVIADIGTDHGYLAVHLLAEDICPKAVLGDVNEGPLNAAAENIQMNHLADRARVELGDGLEVLANQKADTVIIAGMGGPLISSILDNGSAYLDGVTRLILQPNIASDHIRIWLFENGWKIADETIFTEGGHIYEVIAAVPGDPFDVYSREIPLMKQHWIGPLLMQKKNSAFRLKWERELKQLRRIETQLAQAADQARTASKREEIAAKITWLKEELDHENDERGSDHSSV